MNSVHLTGVALAALLSENFILVNCMGIGTQIQAFREPRQALRTGFSVLMSMVATVFFTWLADTFVLRHYNLEYLRLMTFTLVSLGSTALLRLTLYTFLPELSIRLDQSLAATSSNCAALGAALLSSMRGYLLDQALTFAFCGGLGVLLVLVSFAGLRDSVGLAECPKAFRGIPMKLITAALMALALLGFYGLHLE